MVSKLFFSGVTQMGTFTEPSAMIIMECVFVFSLMEQKFLELKKGEIPIALEVSFSKHEH